MAYGNGWTERKSVNWNKVSTSGPSPLPMGLYRGTILEADPRRNKDGTKSLVRCIVEMNESYDGEEVTPRKIYDSGVVIDEEGGFKTKQICEALELDPPESSGYDDVSEFAEQLVGSDVWCHVGLGKPDQNGRVFNEILRYLGESELEEFAETLKSGGAEKKKAPAKAANGRGAKTNGRAAKAEAAPTNGRRARAAEPEEDEDITDGPDAEEEEAAPPKRGRGRPRRDAHA